MMNRKDKAKGVTMRKFFKKIKYTIILLSSIALPVLNANDVSQKSNSWWKLYLPDWITKVLPQRAGSIPVPYVQQREKETFKRPSISTQKFPEFRPKPLGAESAWTKQYKHRFLESIKENMYKQLNTPYPLALDQVVKKTMNDLKLSQDWLSTVESIANVFVSLHNHKISGQQKQKFTVNLSRITAEHIDQKDLEKAWKYSPEPVQKIKIDSIQPSNYENDITASNIISELKKHIDDKNRINQSVFLGMIIFTPNLILDLYSNNRDDRSRAKTYLSTLVSIMNDINLEPKPEVTQPAFFPQGHDNDNSFSELKNYLINIPENSDYLKDIFNIIINRDWIKKHWQTVDYFVNLIIDKLTKIVTRADMKKSLPHYIDALEHAFNTYPNLKKTVIKHDLRYTDEKHQKFDRNKPIEWLRAFKDRNRPGLPKFVPGLLQF